MVWNTDPIETVELVNLIGQAAQGLYSGEAYVPRISKSS